MQFIRFSPELSVSAIATVCAFAFTVVTFVVMQAKSRRLEQAKYADRIRRAASRPAIALERWLEVSQQLFEDVQALCVDADVSLTAKGEVLAVRDSLWREICVAISKNEQRLVDENLGGAYEDLYGYHPEIQELYKGAVERLQGVNEVMKEVLLHQTQADVIAFGHRIRVGQRISSAELGNRLRYTCGTVKRTCAEQMAKVISPVRSELLRVIHATDSVVVSRSIAVCNTSIAFGSFDLKFEEWKGQIAVSRPDRPGASQGVDSNERVRTLGDLSCHWALQRIPARGASKGTNFGF